MVTGQMYRDPKQMDCYEIEAQYVNVGCPKISAGKTPEKPPLPQLPVIEPQPTEKQLPQAPEKNVVSTKLHQPFKKCQWSDPPGRYCYNKSTEIRNPHCPKKARDDVRVYDVLH